jgi:hypothetical protein
MSFAARSLGYLDNLVSISFTAANSIGGIYFYYGWSAYSNGAPGARQYIPGSTMGSVTGSPVFKGVQVVGIYSNSTSAYLTATRYCVLLDGISIGAGFVTGVIINGTTFTPTSGFYDDTIDATAYYFNVGTSTTVITASSTAVIY